MNEPLRERYFERLTDELHRHWIYEVVKSDDGIFVRCTCDDLIRITAQKFTPEPGDPVREFSRHVAEQVDTVSSWYAGYQYGSHQPMRVSRLAHVRAAVLGPTR